MLIAQAADIFGEKNDNFLTALWNINKSICLLQGNKQRVCIVCHGHGGYVLGGYPVGAAISRPHLRSISNLLRRQIAAPTKEINGERKKTELQQRAAVPLDI